MDKFPQCTNWNDYTNKTHTYTKSFWIDKKWTPIKQKYFEIQIGGKRFSYYHNNSSLYSIGCEMHHLTIDHLAFDQSGVMKYGLTYITIF
jgi:hypothetical protein